MHLTTKSGTVAMTAVGRARARFGGHDELR